MDSTTINATAPVAPSVETRTFPGWRRWLAAVLVLAALAYGPSLFGYFLVDDFWHLANVAHGGLEHLFRPWVYSGDDVASYWFAHRRVHALTEQAFFRPAVTLLYGMVLETVGPSANALHLANVSLHVATTAVVFWLAKGLFRSIAGTSPRRETVAALVAAAAYGLHPAHYEAVTWIAANADLLLGLFGTLCVAAFIHADRPGAAAPARRRPALAVLSIVFFVLALMSKEMAVAVPLVLAAWDLVNRPAGESWWGLFRRRWLVHLPYGCILLPYLLWRLPSAAGIYALHSTGNYVVTTESLTGLAQLLANLVYSVGSLFVLYPIVPVDLTGALGVKGLWLVACGGAVVLALVFVALGRVSGASRRVFWFGVLWLLATLAPFMFVQPAQRLVHFPAVGFALMAAAVVSGVRARFGATGRGRNAVRYGVAGVLGVWLMVAAVSSWAMTYVTLGVREVVGALADAVKELPPGTPVYLIDAWQMSWMMEHYFSVRYPGTPLNLQVLTFDPTVLPPKPGLIPDVLVRWFEVLYGEEGGASRSQVTWLAPATLQLDRPVRPYFTGIIAQQMPVATEAATLHVPVDAGAFVAEATHAGAQGVDRLSFRWHRGVWQQPPVFLQWDGARWQPLAVPEAVLAYGTVQPEQVSTGDSERGDGGSEGTGAGDRTESGS